MVCHHPEDQRPHGKELPEVPLADLDQFSLVSPLGVLLSADPLEDFSLQESDPFDDQFITALLKLGKSTSSEEDKGVAKPVSLTVKGDLVHQSIDCSLVVARAGNLSLSKASVAHLEVGIQHAVWESTHANPNAFKHTITGKLVHDQWRLNFSGLLVGVRYKATDKVRLARVESGHELSKGDKVD